MTTKSRLPKAPERPSGPRQARGRMVSRSIAMNEQLGEVSLLADFLFRACIPFLDATGRMTGNPALIKSQVVPLREEFNSGVIPELLRELANSVDHAGIPLVFWYEINGAKVLEFPGFAHHQTGLRVDREAPSKYPHRNGMEKLLSDSGLTPELVRQKSGVGPAQEEVEVEEEDECEEEVRAARARKAAGDDGGLTVDGGPLNADDRALSRALDAALGPDRIASARRFLQRRSASTWGGWIREMLKLIGPGSQFTPDDLASVLGDDSALEQPITGPHALRVFLAKSRSERLSAGAPATNGVSRPTAVAPANTGTAAVTLQRIRELVEEHVVPGQGTKRFIRKTRVADLGPDVLKAYESVGGQDVVLNTPADKLSFLIRDFSQALEAAQHAAA